MRSDYLYWPALTVAAFGAALVPLAVFIGPARETLARPTTMVAVGVTCVLFLWILFDPRCRNGVRAASFEIRDDPRPFGFRRAFSDPEWGLFGHRLGGRPLQLVRAVLWFEFLAALIFTGRATTDILLLAASAFAAAMMLSLIHVGLNTGRAPA